MDVKDVICERFKFLYSTFRVEAMFSSYQWASDEDYPIPVVKVRLQTIDEDDLKDFIRRQLRNRVQFSFDERDIVGLDALYIDGFSSATIESTVRMKEMERVALEDVVSVLMSAIGWFVSGYVEYLAKNYYMDEAIREHLVELDMDYTEDGRLIYEVDERKG